jgi:hypothetical protein
MNQRLFCFAGGTGGAWRVRRITAVIGEPLAAVSHLSVLAADQPNPAGALWLLHGVTSNERYVMREEKSKLVSRQPILARTEATHAALIPIRKTDAWWALSQDDRRQIFEEQSAHIKVGMKYLPEVARRLHHCRDLATPEPFDFLTWFEYAPEHEAAFDALLAELRASPEWLFVEREIDIRLTRDKP